jgi:hypothetical protein
LSDTNSDDLRRAFASLAGNAAGPEACPAPERLWEAVRGELMPEEARALVAHTVDCAACAEAWRLARALEPPTPAQPRLVEPRRARTWWGALAAAATIALVAAGLLVRRAEPPAAPAYRSGDAAPIRSLVPEDRPLPRAAFVLRWTPGPPGTRYGVRVTTEDLTPVTEASDLDAARFTVSADALASLPAGTKLLWQVHAVAPRGGRTLSSTFVSRLE